MSVCHTLNVLDQPKAVNSLFNWDTSQNKVENFYHGDQNLESNWKLRQRNFPITDLSFYQEVPEHLMCHLAWEKTNCAQKQLWISLKPKWRNKASSIAFHI